MKGTDIKPRLDDAGRTQAALGRHLGYDVHKVGRLVRNEKELPPSLAARVEEFFSGARPLEPQLKRVPVYGYVAAGGEDRVAIAADAILDYIEIPVGLVRGEVLGLRVSGDSMEPRLHSGELLLVGLNVAPLRGGDCVIEFRDGSGIVKEYRGQRDGHFMLWQFNPEKELKIPASAVKAVHAVLWRR